MFGWYPPHQGYPRISIRTKKKDRLSERGLFVCRHAASFVLASESEMRRKKSLTAAVSI